MRFPHQRHVGKHASGEESILVEVAISAQLEVGS